MKGDNNARLTARLGTDQVLGRKTRGFHVGMWGALGAFLMTEGFEMRVAVALPIGTNVEGIKFVMNGQAAGPP